MAFTRLARLGTSVPAALATDVTAGETSFS